MKIRTSLNVKWGQWISNYISSYLGTFFFFLNLLENNKHFFSDWPFIVHYCKRNPSFCLQYNLLYGGCRGPTDSKAFPSCPVMNRRCACNYLVLCGVWLWSTEGQQKQGSSFLIFPKEINITERCVRAAADHKAEVTSAQQPLASERKRNDSVISETSGMQDRKWQSLMNERQL